MFKKGATALMGSVSFFYRTLQYLRDLFVFVERAHRKCIYSCVAGFVGEILYNQILVNAVKCLFFVLQIPESKHMAT